MVIYLSCHLKSSNIFVMLTILRVVGQLLVGEHSVGELHFGELLVGEHW